MRTQLQLLTLCLSFLLAACSQPTPAKLADPPPIVKASASPQPPDLAQITVNKIKLNQDSSDPYAIVALRLEPAYLELRTLEVAKIKVVVQLANGQIVEVINQSKLNWQIPDPRLLNHLNGTLKALQTGETLVKVQIGQHQADLKVKILNSSSGSGSGATDSPPQLKLGRTDYPLAVGESVYLDAKLILPDGSESKDLIYSVDQAELFELDVTSGRLRRLKEGAATVTIQARLNGNVQQTVSIANKAPEKGSGGGGGGGGSRSTASATPSPSPSASASVSPSPSPTVSVSPSPSPTVSASTPEPTPTPNIDGKIVFVSNIDGDQEIFIMNPDGSNILQLTHNKFDDGFPKLSPDGTKIVFQSDRIQDHAFDIFVMNIDGSNTVNLTNSIASEKQPEWSPDGEKIAFNSFIQYVDPSTRFYYMNSDGSNVTYITENVQEPAWSPDGKKIAFRSFKNHYPNIDIYVIDLDTKVEVNLTNSSERIYDMSPTWSPDGSQIAFTSQYLFNGLTQHPIHIINSDGTNEVARTDLPIPGDIVIRWAPRGAQLLIGIDNRIGLINIDGSGEVVYLTTSNYRAGLPSWR